MSLDFIIYTLGVALFGLGYLLGRRHGRKAEQQRAQTLGVDTDRPAVGVVGPWRPKK